MDEHEVEEQRLHDRRQARALAGALSPRSYQARVADWVVACFGPEVAGDRVERNHRFLEEAVELVQALGCSREDAHTLVDYTFDRPKGDVAQEVGGVLVTLAALCSAAGVEMVGAGEVELDRVGPLIEKIRAKQSSKPHGSPLPGRSAPLEAVMRAPSRCCYGPTCACGAPSDGQAPAASLRR
jgi:hypothetical protein